MGPLVCCSSTGVLVLEKVNVSVGVIVLGKVDSSIGVLVLAKAKALVDVTGTVFVVDSVKSANDDELKDTVVIDKDDPSSTKGVKVGLGALVWRTLSRQAWP